MAWGEGGEISGREKTVIPLFPLTAYTMRVGIERRLFINMRTVVPGQFPSNTCWYPRSYPDAGEIFNAISVLTYPPRFDMDNNNVLTFFLEGISYEGGNAPRRYIYSLVPCPFPRRANSFFLSFCFFFSPPPVPARMGRERERRRAEK